MPHNWRPTEEQPVDPAVLAANRIMHLDYPETNTNGQTLDALMADAQLVAGAFIEAVTE